MNRRQFMTTVSATALAVATPISALAGTTITSGAKSVRRLDIVFQIMEDYGFSQVDDKAGLFSYYSGQFEDFDQLYKIVHRTGVQCGQRDLQDRMGFLLTIKQKLTERFGDNLLAHMTWLDTLNSKLRDRTPREMMSTRNYFDIRQVVQILEEESDTV